MELNNTSNEVKPYLGQEFDSEQDAYEFYNRYAICTGFAVRKEGFNRSKTTGIITSRRFVCAKEGSRAKDKRDHLTKRPRVDTRCNCFARLVIQLNRDNGKYFVSDFVEEHTHCTSLTSCYHMIPLHTKISLVQELDINLADDGGIRGKSICELAVRQAGGGASLGHTQSDQINYLKTKRQRNPRYGEVGNILRYFQRQSQENPTFFYAMQLDNEEQITNVFWADARMIVDYAYFGDAITFDTIFSTNRDYRPFGVFTGFNHHRGVVVFGATLLYDETIDSFKWLFKTFLEAHKNKKPQTILTCQDRAMDNAIQEVMPEPDTIHGLCIWHILQDGMKQLGNSFKDGTELFKDFTSCVFDHDSVSEFENVWLSMLSMHNIQHNSWLHEIYALKEKWANAYMTRAFTIGMRSTRPSESLNADLKGHLKSNLDIMHFFKHFERAVNDKRCRELEAEYQTRQESPNLKLKKAPMLNQAAEIYTPLIFEMFQDEYDEYQGASIKISEKTNTYVISLYGKDKDFDVIAFSNEFDTNVSCTCRKFETFGILCSHSLKALNFLDVHVIPQKFILKRWTKNAKNGIAEDTNYQSIHSNDCLVVRDRYRILCSSLVKLASRAAESDIAFQLVSKVAEDLNKQIEGLPSEEQGNHEDPLVQSNVKGFRKEGCRRTTRPKR